jgi:serine/threonine protein kinase
MTLTAGTRLGVYEIIAPLGAGGMGEVYRARDASLGRDVAIKVLPDVFAQDAERLARFEREAKTLASVNHPNIAHVYGLEQADGVRGLVTELVEGPTLADRIARGAMPFDEALPIAKQILKDSVEPPITQIVIAQNWVEELKCLAPAKSQCRTAYGRPLHLSHGGSSIPRT